MPKNKYITYHRSLIKIVSRTQISTNTITDSKVTKTTKKKNFKQGTHQIQSAFDTFVGEMIFLQRGYSLFA